MVKKIEQREASLEKLRKAALSLFVSQGYHATTLEDIAAAAGLTKGAVYFYFGSKSAVLVDLLGRVQRIVVERMMEAVERAGPSPTEKLVAFLHNQAMLGITHRDEVLLLILMSLEARRQGRGRIGAHLRHLSAPQPIHRGAHPSRAEGGRVPRRRAGQGALGGPHGKP